MPDMTDYVFPDLYVTVGALITVIHSIEFANQKVMLNFDKTNVKQERACRATIVAPLTGDYVDFELIAHRYERGSLLITTNQAFSEWDSIFGDNMMTVAVIDRLVHHADIYQIKGDSYRKKQALERNSNRPS